MAWPLILGGLTLAATAPWLLREWTDELGEWGLFGGDPTGKKRRLTQGMEANLGYELALEQMGRGDLIQERALNSLLGGLPFGAMGPTLSPRADQIRMSLELQDLVAGKERELANLADTGRKMPTLTEVALQWGLM